MLTELDLNLRLLRGLPIEVQGIKIYPVTIDDIVNVTFEKYSRFLNLLCMDKENIKELGVLAEEINPFDFFYINSALNDSYKSLVFEALEFFLREKIGLYICDIIEGIEKKRDFKLNDEQKKNIIIESIDSKGFYVGSIDDGKIINNDIFNEIVKIIKLQNCIVEKEEEEKIRPANERARKMLEQMRKNEEELNKIKAKNALTFHDLVSIFAAYSENTNILNVWDLTFYQFNDQFNRLTIMKTYEANLQILMHCDTSKNKIELKHWLSNK
ncbi:MAG: hypothetical protein WDA59_10715 [Methanofastidiosum sp.]